MKNLPNLTSIDIITKRLPKIFPEGTPNRGAVTRETAAKAIFSMLYIGAVDGNEIMWSPKFAYRMTDIQSKKLSDSERKAFITNIAKKGFVIPGKVWYKDNSREGIRDDIIRYGLVPLGVILVDPNIPTTSSKPRYALKKSFADLFDPKLKGDTLIEEISNWQKVNLSRDSLRRILLVSSGANSGDEDMLVTLPNKETRFLKQGPSSVISKQVIEVFAPKFMIKPYLLWLSESGKKVIQRDDELANELGLNIDSSKHLPDIIMVDLNENGNKLTIIFIEVVATDGAITAERMKAFYKITDAAEFPRSQIAFVTAYLDRQSSAFKKTISQLTWNSYAWFVSEPDNIFILHNGDFKIANLNILNNTL